MFYSIPNLSSEQVTPVEKPWELTVERPVFPVKADFTRWCAEVTTKHCFISGVQALAPLVRVQEENNPPLKMHALIVDYDATADDATREKLCARPKSEYLPAWFIRTVSGNARLVWLFEEPALFGTTEHAEKFFAVLAKKLQLIKWLPGLDTGALNPRQYFEASDWVPMSPGYRIPKAIVDLWLYEAASRTGDIKQGLPEIPLDIVKQEVDAVFPGRWPGAFELKSMGPRFWDAAAGNPRGACVLSTGMMAFSGEQGFLSWKTIFGQKFVEKWLSSKTEGMLDSWAFDGQQFWRRGPDGRWQYHPKDNATLLLKDLGVSHQRGSYNPGTSELEHFIAVVLQQRRVERALPFTHRPKGIMCHPSTRQRYLNVSSVDCIQPAAPVTSAEGMTFHEMKDHCPTVHQILRTFFCSKVDVPPDQAEKEAYQLQHFLSWCKHFYVNCLKQTPTPGQVAVVAGPPNKGKTFFMNYILGPLVGGAVDAKEHLIYSSPWTEHLANSALWLVDDSEATADARTFQLYSSRLKAYVANAKLHFNQKFRQTGDIPFEGRIVVLCNLDPMSMRILPSVDMSSDDKINMYRASEQIEKLERENVCAAIQAELPYFARFLVDWKYPEGIYSVTNRFGVSAYHDPMLLAESRNQGSSAILLEILRTFGDDFSDRFKDSDGVYETSATKLFQELSTYNSQCMHEFTVRSMATSLAMLARTMPTLIQSRRDKKTNVSKWWIKFPLYEGAA